MASPFRSSHLKGMLARTTGGCLPWGIQRQAELTLIFLHVQIHFALHHPDSGTYQRRVGHMRLLGELYNYRLLDSVWAFLLILAVFLKSTHSCNVSQIRYLMSKLNFTRQRIDWDQQSPTSTSIKLDSSDVLSSQTQCAGLCLTPCICSSALAIRVLRTHISMIHLPTIFASG